MTTTIPATTTTKVELSPQVQAILERFRAGDKSLTHADARALFRAKPNLLETTGNPSHVLLDNWIQRTYPDPANVASRQAMYENFRRVKADLAGPTPTPAENLLAERAALCWLEASCLEMSQVAGKGEIPPVVAGYWIKRVDSANRRFLAAVRTLAVVRKLAVPDVRLNIDNRAVYMGGKPTDQGDQTIPIG